MWSSQPGHGLLSWRWVYPSPASRSTGIWLGRSCRCPWQPLPLWLWGVTAAEVVAPGAEQHLHSTQASSHSCSSPSGWAGRTRKWEGTQGAREVSHTVTQLAREVSPCSAPAPGQQRKRGLRAWLVLVGGGSGCICIPRGLF